MKPILTPEQYAIERAICDKAEAYYATATRLKRGKACNYLTAQECTHPDYAACDNDMRGRVEQYEILTEMPHTIVAYLGKQDIFGIWPVTVWTGVDIGRARETSSWRVNSYVGSRMYQFEARIAGRTYTGRGFGDGMCIVLRETAKSKRERNA